MAGLAAASPPTPCIYALRDAFERPCEGIFHRDGPAPIGRAPTIAVALDASSLQQGVHLRRLDRGPGRPGKVASRFPQLGRAELGHPEPIGDRPLSMGASELLPREEAWHEDCEQCERHLERREGPKAPRNFHFVARGIAEALVAVGAGATYMRASGVARDRARRFRVDSETGELRESDHGQLVADWVELFAPVVFEPHRPTFWPPEGSLLLDHLPFRVRALDADGKRIPAGRVAFDVFCAVGYQAGKPKLWHAEAFTSAHPANWSAFLGALPGEPKRIVCDAHGGMLRAVEGRWPGAELQQCEWHLQHALERLLAKEARSNPTEELEELRTRAEGALTGPSFWRSFVHAAKIAGNESLERWVAVNGPVIEKQFARRGRSSERPADMPLTTAALEQLARPITAALYPRRYALKNRERLNRLLMLLQLHVNGHDDVQGYTKTIRSWLEANGGRPAAQRRAIADPAGAPSLR